ncbi:hypothetical protein Cni_G02683 [Canna indica]|uniref:Uncharacterized protein n=1 Tax=Canna indica TaxID=4628 RepID=A0AAQ3Q2X4_9LILI|nr:hypothetical protein Cni_G02683 [Canna indica]
MARLDKAYANREWLNKYSKTQVIHLRRLRETMEQIGILEKKDANGVASEHELDELKILVNKAVALNRQIQIK